MDSFRMVDQMAFEGWIGFQDGGLSVFKGLEKEEVD